MNKIPSFTINHNKLLRGIYVSRKDEVTRSLASTTVPSIPSSTWLPPTSETTRSGKTASSIGDRWDASPATTSSSVATYRARTSCR